MSKTYTVTLYKHAESVTDATPVNVVITVVGSVFLLLGIAMSNLYFTGSIFGL